MTKNQINALKAVANARVIRNPFVGKFHEQFYKIDGATMRIIKALAAKA